jgi:ribosomal protein S20
MTAFETFRKALTDLYPAGISELERMRNEQARSKVRSYLKETYWKQKKAASTGDSSG